MNETYEVDKICEIAKMDLSSEQKKQLARTLKEIRQSKNRGKSR